MADNRRGPDEDKVYHDPNAVEPEADESPISANLEPEGFTEFRILFERYYHLPPKLDTPESRAFWFNNYRDFRAMYERTADRPRRELAWNVLADKDHQRRTMEAFRAYMGKRGISTMNDVIHRADIRKSTHELRAIEREVERFLQETLPKSSTFMATDLKRSVLAEIEKIQDAHEHETSFVPDPDAQEIIRRAIEAAIRARAERVPSLEALNLALDAAFEAAVIVQRRRLGQRCPSPPAEPVPAESEPMEVFVVDDEPEEDIPLE